MRDTFHRLDAPGLRMLAVYCRGTRHVLSAGVDLATNFKFQALSLEIKREKVHVTASIMS